VRLVTAEPPIAPGKRLTLLCFRLFSYFAFMRLKVCKGAEVGAECSFGLKSWLPPSAEIRHQRLLFRHDASRVRELSRNCCQFRSFFRHGFPLPRDYIGVTFGTHWGVLWPGSRSACRKLG
jgi:hypothetical protein